MIDSVSQNIQETPQSLDATLRYNAKILSAHTSKYMYMMSRPYEPNSLRVHHLYTVDTACRFFTLPKVETVRNKHDEIDGPRKN